MSTLFHTVNKKKGFVMPGAAPSTKWKCGPSTTTDCFYLLCYTSFLPNRAAATHQRQTPEAIRLSSYRRRITDFSVCFCFPEDVGFSSWSRPNSPRGRKKKKERKTAPWPSLFFSSKNQKKKFGAPFCEEDVRFCVLFSLDLASDHYILYK